MLIGKIKPSTDATDIGNELMTALSEDHDYEQCKAAVARFVFPFGAATSTFVVSFAMLYSLSDLAVAAALVRICDDVGHVSPSKREFRAHCLTDTLEDTQQAV